MPVLAPVLSQPSTSWRSSLVAESAVMHRLLDQIDRIASSTVPVLLTGETGTGKDVLASVLQESSGRRGPLTAVNCAALPPSLAETELFGHVRGSFTSAERSRDGLIVQAHRGTLLLDEIGELDLATQAKLLRVLEDGAVRRVGSTSITTVDIRLVCATNRDLRALVSRNQFRADLYHRIAGVTLHIPPLRDRSNDIPALVQRFLNESCTSRLPRVTDETIAHLKQRPWLGNVRELRYAVQRAVLFGGSILTPMDFPQDDVPRANEPGEPYEGKRWTEIERDVLAWSLKRYGTLAAAARALGLPTSTLHDRFRRAGVPTTPRALLLP